MKQSLSYYITLFVIKLKGLKKEFSKDPIDYLKIRKEDVHHPKGRFFKSRLTRTFEVSKTTVSEITGSSSELLIFIHGGAFISGPAQHHWDTLKRIATETKLTIWMCDYPKAPEHGIVEISENIDQVYSAALKEYQAGHISLIGDSVGGTLITALVQRLVQKNMELPKKIMLISPVMDASLTHPEIAKLEHLDPMLSRAGVLSAKKMCAGDIDLHDAMISPLYGSFDTFPSTVLYLAENDITYPDQKLAMQKLKKAQVSLEVIEGKNMPHIWPLLPVMQEAKTALNDTITRLNR